MLAQPVALLAPARAALLDERPEAPRVVEDTQVAELVHDHVVEHLGGGQHEAPVEGERPLRGARAPDRALAADPDPLVGDSKLHRLLLGDPRHEPPGAGARRRLADRVTLQSQPRHLTTPLRLYPSPLIAQHPLHLNRAHRARHGQLHRPTPGTSSRHRRARGDLRTSTPSTRATVAVSPSNAIAFRAAAPSPGEHRTLPLR